MRTLFVAFIIVAAITAYADDLEGLKAASVRYVAAVKAALVLSDGAECSQTVANANGYAAAKIAYYDAARQAMPALLQITKGQDLDSSYGKELTEIFRGFDEDKDEEATRILDGKLDRCPASGERAQARKAINRRSKLPGNSQRTSVD
jgi:hypothetical protein